MAVTHLLYHEHLSRCARRICGNIQSTHLLYLDTGIHPPPAQPPSLKESCLGFQEFVNLGLLTQGVTLH
jgi:hypothetical protein